MFVHQLLPAALTMSMTVMQVLPASAFAGAGIPRSMFLPKTTQMAERGPASAPFGHVEFCTLNPSECRRNASMGRYSTLSGGTWRMLQQVNLKVNATIRPQSDAARGKIDKWSLGGSKGDCEDYAITKRSELIKRGWAADSMLLATVRDRLNRPHAVLVAHTDRGDFVLDNMTGEIKAWNKTGYTWLKRQSTSDPTRWVSLSAQETARTLDAPSPSAPRSGSARAAFLMAALDKVRGRKSVVEVRASQDEVAPPTSARLSRKAIARSKSSRSLMASLRTLRSARRTASSSTHRKATSKRYGKRWVRTAFGNNWFTRL